jgi:hypothetical protein
MPADRLSSSFQFAFGQGHEPRFSAETPRERPRSVVYHMPPLAAAWPFRLQERLKPTHLERATKELQQAQQILNSLEKNPALAQPYLGEVGELLARATQSVIDSGSGNAQALSLTDIGRACVQMTLLGFSDPRANVALGWVCEHFPLASELPRIVDAVTREHAQMVATQLLALLEGLPQRASLTHRETGVLRVVAALAMRVENPFEFHASVGKQARDMNPLYGVQLAQFAKVFLPEKDSSGRIATLTFLLDPPCSHDVHYRGGIAKRRAELREKAIHGLARSIEAREDFDFKRRTGISMVRKNAVAQLLRESGEPDADADVAPTQDDIQSRYAAMVEARKLWRKNPEQRRRAGDELVSLEGLWNSSDELVFDWAKSTLSDPLNLDHGGPVDRSDAGPVESRKKARHETSVSTGSHADDLD